MALPHPLMLLRPGLTTNFAGTAHLLHASLLDPTGPVARLWDTLDRAIAVGQGTHPMNVATLRRAAIEHPDYKVVFTAVEGFRNHLQDALAPYKHSSEAPLPGEAEEFDVNSFLRAQGISFLAIADPKARSECEEAAQEVKMRWDSTVARLLKYENVLQRRILSLVAEHQQTRPAVEHETTLRVDCIHRHFVILRAMLKQRLTTDLMEFVRPRCCPSSGSGSDGDQATRKRRPLDAKAVAVLSKWWDEHASEPYPSEEEKAVLGAAADLTLVQVNNWFSNKRIRTKRKNNSSTAEEK